MEEFPRNSRTGPPSPGIPAEEAKKKVERVTTSEPIRRKAPLGRRFVNTFVKGDARQAWVTVVADVLIPAAKDMAADALTQGFERMIFGETRSRSRRPPWSGGGYGGSQSHVSYNRYSSPGGSPQRSRNTPDEGRRPPMSRQSRAAFNFDEIILTTRVEADEVIEQLFNLIAQYEVATVADLYGLVGVTGEYTDEKWGWADIRGANVSRTRDGYLLNLPKPEPLDAL